MEAMETRPMLTPRQKDVLDYIRDYLVINEYPPTVREIARKFGHKSTNGTVGHLNALMKKGYITRLEITARGIRLVESRMLANAVTIPAALRVGDRVVIECPPSLSLAEARVFAMKLYQMATIARDAKEKDEEGGKEDE